MSFLDANARAVSSTSLLKQPSSKIDEISGLEIDTRNVLLSGEFSLEAHGIWQRYLEVIEDNMEEFMRSERLNSVEFKQAIEDLPKNQSMLIRLMIASWEFEQFVDLCKDHCEYMDEQAKAGGGGTGSFYGLEEDGDEKDGGGDDDYYTFGDDSKFDSKESDDGKSDCK
jgi:hypothetical protein